MNTQNVEEGKTIAIISYLTWIGTLIAFFMNNSKKNSFASFHIRQMIGLIVLQFGVSLIGNLVGLGMVEWAIHLFLLILWGYGFIGCINGKEKKIPLLGDLFQDWFKGI